MHHDVPILTVHLIPALDDLLITVLKSLAPEDWEKQTLAPAWVVKDVVAHLLDGNIRSLSTSQDGYFPKNGSAIESYSDLVKYLNQLNADWVTAMKRVSPEVLIALLDMTNKRYSDHLAQLDPFAKSIFPVAWAGESESQNWFHIAREYTEKWHHQQQIRETLGTASPLFEKRFFRPFLDTSLRHLPHHFRNLKGEQGDTFSLIITGEGGGEWHLIYESDGWKVCEEKPSYSVTLVRIDDQVIWRMLSNQITSEELQNRMTITGKKEPADLFLQMRSFMI